MLKRLFWVALGAAGALQADRWLREKRASLTPNALTGTVLDKVNQRLEAKNQDAARPGQPES